MLSKQGEFLAYTDSKRMEWYTSRGLAEKTSEKEFQLTFEHHSRGNDSYPSETHPRDNLCVVCASSLFLERHHVVPYCFRRHFKTEYKSYNSYDVLPLCVSCHDKYERVAEAEKVILREAVTEIEELKRVRRLLKTAWGLRTKYTELPQEAIDRLWSRLPDDLHNDFEALDDFIASYEEVRAQLDDWAKRVVLRDGEDSITLFWRNHFVEKMNPQHLPVSWREDMNTIICKSKVRRS